MRLRAKKLLFANNRRVRPGEEFDVPDSRDPGEGSEIVIGPETPQPWQQKRKRVPVPGSVDALAIAVAALQLRVDNLEAAAKDEAVAIPPTVPEAPQEAPPAADSWKLAKGPTSTDVVEPKRRGRPRKD